MDTTPDDPRGPAPPDDADTLSGTDGDDDEHADDLTDERRFLGGRRMVCVAVVAVVLLGAVAAVALGGDGGDGDGSAAGDDSGSGDQLADAAFEYAECMRENGLEDWPDPEVDEDGDVSMDPGGGDAYDLDDPEVEAANDACRSILEEAEPADDGSGPTPEQQAALQDQTLAMAQCMRDRGWDFPDPELDVDGGAVGIAVDDATLPEEGDPDFDQFEQDHEECNDEAGVPTPQDGGGGG